ncbi:MAG: hypothetical protein WD749_03555 [Phycisphaerales bacterium]
MFCRKLARFAAIVGALAAVAPALGWGARGHRTITRLALDGLGPELPAWVRDPEVVSRIAEQSNEPDRWRGTKLPAIGHELNPEHYIDVEDLEPFGLALATLPQHRYEYFRAMVKAKLEHPGRMAPYDPAKDPDRSKEWPGFLPYAIAEHFAKLQSSFHTYRVLEALDDPARAEHRLQARENAIYEMGILSHYVGDASQPLHTTRHHHGWVGPNPRGYTRENGFHSYVDSRIVEIHGLGYDALRPGMRYDATIDARDPWPGCIAFIQRSFDGVGPLYELEKSGELTRESGKAFIETRLRDSASTLAALYTAAWEAARPTDADIAAFIRYSEMRGRRRGGNEATQPAGTGAPPPP